MGRTGLLSQFFPFFIKFFQFFGDFGFLFGKFRTFCHVGADFRLAHKIVDLPVSVFQPGDGFFCFCQIILTLAFPGLFFLLLLPGKFAF